MHRFICFNRQILPAENARLAAVSAAALYGKSIFTTVAVYNFKTFLWEKHWTRLTENARKLGVDVSDFTESEIKNFLLEIIERNNLQTVRARVTFFDESPTLVWQNDSTKKISFLIQTADFRPVKNHLKLTVSPFRVNSASPLAGVKSGNYLENILAWETAKAKNYDEAIRLNERGEIVSACLANVFWKKNGEIFTPSLETGCLRGTTRDFFMENQTVKETKANLIALLEADEIFLTSAGISVVKADLVGAQASCLH